MRESIRQTRSYLMELFEKHGYRPRTDLGQNFLIDLNILEYVVSHAKLEQRDLVLEVGAGTGGMTTFLAQNAGHVISVELDRNMYSLASEQTKNYENVTLLNFDALKNKNRFAPKLLEEIEKRLQHPERKCLKLISNLPYSIGTPVISNLVGSDLPWERMVVTIQLELGLKMQAKSQSSDYGSLSVWLQTQAFVKLLKKLPPTVFWPRPQVNSAIVQLVPKPGGKEDILDRPFFLDFLRRLFSQRRKLLRSTVAGMYRKDISKSKVDQILDFLELSTNVRAEEMPPQQLLTLANTIYLVVSGQEEKLQEYLPELPAFTLNKPAANTPAQDNQIITPTNLEENQG